PRTKTGTPIVALGLSELRHSQWAEDLGQYQPVTLSVVADTRLALPALRLALRQRGRGRDRSARCAELARTHREIRERWEREAREDWDAAPRTAAHHRIPMLVVMYNNRAYYNDWEHQLRVAQHRGTPKENARVGQEIDDPAPDFAMLARSFGWHAEGPIVDPAKVRPALERALEVVRREKRPALVDTIVRHRQEKRFR